MPMRPMNWLFPPVRLVKSIKHSFLAVLWCPTERWSWISTWLLSFAFSTTVKQRSSLRSTVIETFRWRRDEQWTNQYTNRGDAEERLIADVAELRRTSTEEISSVRILKIDGDLSISSRCLFDRADNTVRTIYYNKMNMAHSSTVDWTREPMSSMSGIMNTLAEDMKW